MSYYSHESGIDEFYSDFDDSEYIAERTLADRRDIAAEVAAMCPTTTIFGIPFETASLRAIAPFARFSGTNFHFVVNDGVVSLNGIDGCVSTTQ